MRAILLLLLLVTIDAASKYDSLVKTSNHLSQSEMLKWYNEKYSGSAKTTCAEPSKTKQQDNKLHQIFLLPHTHDDVGWQYTVFGYFNNSVHHILDSVVADLGNNLEHRFIWSEIKWIEMWWPLQNTSTKATFKRIVANGQFEFVGAGWSQSDEVTPSYRDMIQNTVTGHEYLRTILGPLNKACPAKGNGRCIRFGWQIDMFAGYSATTPTLWSNAGYDGMVIRFEGPDKLRNEWNKQQNYEYLWEGSNVLSSNKTRIATHVIRWNYGDMLLGNRSGPEYGYRGPALTFDFGTKKLNNQSDVEKYAKELVYWSVHRGSVYRNNRHLAAWGSDFQFTNAGLWFEQMDLLFKEINDNPKKYNATIQYTTLSTYFDHVHSLNESFPVKTGLDFEFGWPHSWSPEGVPLIGLTSNFSWQYQTGATSSRPNHKKQIRKSASTLRSAQAGYAQALASGALSMNDNTINFQTSWDALGVMQHHDSMPGTMRTKESVECIDNMAINYMYDGTSCPKETDPNRHVLTDYTLRLVEADLNTNAILISSLEATNQMKPKTLNATFNQNANALLVFNPSTSTRTELIQMEFQRPKGIPVTTLPTVSVMNLKEGTATPITAQIMVNNHFVSSNTGGAGGSSTHTPPSSYIDALYFVADNVKPLDTNHYTISWNKLKNSTTTVYPTIKNGIDGIGLDSSLFENDMQCLKVEFNPDDTLGSFISTGCNGPDIIQMEYRQTYKQYLDGGGGAYCIIEQDKAVEVPLPYYVQTVYGPCMQEVVHKYAYSSGLTQRTRIIINDPTVHVIHDGGRLPSDRELVSSISTSIHNTAATAPDLPILYTEASGAVELYPRVFNSTSPISQNYHAMVQSAVIRDAVDQSARQFSVITKRTMGIASLKKGEMEYMLMRRISAASDNQGPWPLNDMQPMEDEHMRLILNTAAVSEKVRFATAVAHEHSMNTFYYDSRTTGGDGSGSGVSNRGGVDLAIGGLPNSVWSEVLVRKDAVLNASYVVRMQYIVASKDGTDGSIEVGSLSSILAPWKVYNCVETTLTMLQSRVDNNQVRLQWNGEGDDDDNGGNEIHNTSNEDIDCDTEIELASLDIRTFVFGIVAKE